VTDDTAGTGTPETPATPGTPVSEDLRRRAVDLLCEAFADDRITVEEFERRVEVAHRSETTEELRELLADVPAPPLPAKKSESAATELTVPRPSARAVLHPEDRPGTSVIVGILGGGSRKGAWRPARTNWAVGVLGGFELDFRDAALAGGVTEVRVFAVLGGGEIVVPPDVVVEVSGVGIMGGFEHDAGEPAAQHPDAPVIRVTGFACMGGASVVVRRPGETAGDAKRRRKLEKKERRRLARGDG
jgi:DUF1707 SHOCT-like domain